ncbi:HAD family hydrolase [Sporosarcina ureilytica]|uniref:Haloacid dehalogenase n=1 Tax=Sporosarcina ureilytica TaxID=298596 RepID=A0A1D8JEH2_9BACL|nr:HAD-IB family hydrolase [Sporosarcina ureilytica]AOV07099.1 haloacid dehalogenase [Sporosarcina ureilytica]
MRVAIFDFDGTLYSKETYQILMDHLKEHPLYRKRYPQFMRSILPPYIASKAKLYPTEKMRERSMQIYLNALNELTIEEADIYFEQIAQKMREDFNEAVVDKVKEHASDDFYLMLVSGAYTPLLHTAVQGLPFDTIIGTDIPVTNGKITSKSPVYHIQGTRKNEKIQQALQGKKVDWQNSIAYADSYSDLSVLSLVGNPVAVQPEPKLQTIAERREWTIL